MNFVMAICRLMFDGISIASLTGNARLLAGWSSAASGQG
jgi:hypothetical protein